MVYTYNGILNSIIPFLVRAFNDLWKGNMLTGSYFRSISVLLNKRSIKTSSCKNPIKMSDLRLISLFNTDHKLLMKCIFNRLCKVCHNVLHRAQYGTRGTRPIHEILDVYTGVD